MISYVLGMLRLICHKKKTLDSGTNNIGLKYCTVSCINDVISSEILVYDGEISHNALHSKTRNCFKQDNFISYLFYRPMQQKVDLHLHPILLENMSSVYTPTHQLGLPVVSW